MVWAPGSNHQCHGPPGKGTEALLKPVETQAITRNHPKRLMHVYQVKPRKDIAALISNPMHCHLVVWQRDRGAVSNDLKKGTNYETHRPFGSDGSKRTEFDPLVAPQVMAG